MGCDKHSFQLQTCVWEITLDCCFSCEYCGSKAGKAREKELTTEECFGVGRQLADMGCNRVSLIGGEVFMRRDWHQIVKALTDLHIRVCIISNGFIFSDQLIELIKYAGVESVAISLDGPKSVHDRFRQSGSFERAVHAIDILTKNHIPTAVISTLHSQNIGRLEELYQVLKDKPIGAWQLQACSPMGNAANAGIDCSFDFASAIRFVERHLPDVSFMLGIADNIGYFTKNEGRLRGNTSGKAFFRGCKAGLSTVGIDSIGNVRGCESMYAECFIEGNLREKSLREIWEDPNAFLYNRQFSKSKLTGCCSECKYGSICAGGCRSYNYFAHRKMYESTGCVLGKC